MYDDAVCVLKGPERRKIPKMAAQIWLEVRCRSSSES